ncbi:class I SAM-dependent methyltransferase [Phenylobacterium sp.]|jgi:predicted methyltransferase|uniref:class I SAM-dependent methyltransferase n=1 Tax=Phenylobacterium sp. TaxID=1871053 RepID=UPI0037839FA3
MFRSLAIAAAVAMIAAPAVAADPALEAAVAAPHRSAEDRARDPHRHPVESLTFWGLKPGQTVIEIAPGGGYWTEILAPYARATNGRYFATTSPRAREAFAKRFADTGRYGAVNLVEFGPTTTSLGPAGSADLVLTARNLHNFIVQPGYLDRVMVQMFAVLKPGGVLAVEEHRSDPKPEAANWSTGYMAEKTVIAAAEKAGFRLAAKSEINANPKDDKDHPFGVWTLPPTRVTAPYGTPQNPNFDRREFDAVGESDRMTLRFVKPS